MRREVQVVLSLEKSKLYMSSYHGGGASGAISQKVDVTPVFGFVQDIIEHDFKIRVELACRTLAENGGDTETLVKIQEMLALDPLTNEETHE